MQIEQSRRREVEVELDRRVAVEKVHSLSYFDALTGLPNRRLLKERLERSLEFSIRSNSHGAVLFVDLDEFNALNDTSGHQVGDQLLTEVARRILAAVHGDDTVPRIQLETTNWEKLVTARLDSYRL
jgi:GGDEF domain-containing protein